MEYYDIVSEEIREDDGITLPHFDNQANCNWIGINKWLKTEFKIDGTQGIKEKVHKLLSILQNIYGKFSWYNSLESPIQETLTETLKVFRLYVISEDVARFLVNDSMFHMTFCKLMQCIFTKKNGPELYTKYLLQLFLNLLSVGTDEHRKDTREKIRRYYFGCFKQFFINAYGCIYETSAVLYNLLSDVELKDDGLINTIIWYHRDTGKSNEYLDFLIEKMISTDFLWQIYEELDVKTRLILLSCLREVLISSNSSSLLIKMETLPVSCLKCFVAIFNKSANVVFQVSQPGCTSASQEVSYILELLSHISSEEKYLTNLQKNKDIFINAGVLLLNIHRLGQVSNNIFTPIHKLTQTENPIDETRNPVLGFKADLVRLLGNLCWKNRGMQDLAREAEVIPVLLDCCNIDERNPFIIQWVIFAIRNICENNRENQAIIAGLTQQRVINADVLQQCGLKLYSEDDLTVKIIGLDLNK